MVSILIGPPGERNPVLNIIPRSPTRHSRYGDGASGATRDLLCSGWGERESRSLASLGMTKRGEGLRMLKGS
jgi:hypothetical protein